MRNLERWSVRRRPFSGEQRSTLLVASLFAGSCITLGMQVVTRIPVILGYALLFRLQQDSALFYPFAAAVILYGLVLTAASAALGGAVVGSLVPLGRRTAIVVGVTTGVLGTALPAMVAFGLPGVGPYPWFTLAAGALGGGYGVAKGLERRERPQT